MRSWRKPIVIRFNVELYSSETNENEEYEEIGGNTQRSNMRLIRIDNFMLRYHNCILFYWFNRLIDDRNYQRFQSQTFLDFVEIE